MPGCAASCACSAADQQAAVRAQHGPGAKASAARKFAHAGEHGVAFVLLEDEFRVAQPQQPHRTCVGGTQEHAIRRRGHGNSRLLQQRGGIRSLQAHSRRGLNRHELQRAHAVAPVFWRACFGS
jgi:hypothetical protein